MPFFIISDIGRTVVKIRRGAVCDNAAVKSAVNLRVILDLSVYNKRAVGRKERCKLMEGVSDIFQILEEIQVVFFNIQYHTDLREEVKETVRVLAGFCEESFGTADADIAADGLEDSSNGDRGIRFPSRRIWEIMEVVVVFP